MTKLEALTKRAALEDMLTKYESGSVRNFDTDEKGVLQRELTAELCAMLRQSIADIDWTIAELWPDS